MSLTLAATIGADDEELAVAGVVPADLASGFSFRLEDEILLMRRFGINRTNPSILREDRSTWIVWRGREGSTAASHASGTAIDAVADAWVASDDLTPPGPLASGGAPAAHAASHEDAGSDEVALAQSQVTGLEAALAALDPSLLGVTRLRKIVVAFDRFTLDPALGVTVAPIYELQEGDWLFFSQVLVTEAFDDTNAGDPTFTQVQISAADDTGGFILGGAGGFVLAPVWTGGINLVNADQGTDAEVWSVGDPHLPMTPTPGSSPVQLHLRSGLALDGTQGILQALLWVNEFTARGIGSRLGFGQQPTAADVDAVITPAVTVRALKDDGTVATSDQTTQITLSLTNESVGGGALGGTLTRTVVNGVATFTDLTLDTAEDATLLATADNECGKVTSALFTVSAP